MQSPKSVFVDADAFISLNFHKHPTYSQAIKISEKIDKLRLEVFTCTFVLLEVATVLNMHFSGKRGPQVVEEIILTPTINIVKGDEFIKEGIQFMKNQTSKNISLNDCVYFAIVKNLNLDTVFSFDKHWAKNKFNLLK